VSPDHVLQHVLLNARHRRVQSRLAPLLFAGQPAQLAIAKRDDCDAYALLYLDHNGRRLGETMHEQLGLAIGQAEWEYAVAPNDWQRVASGIARSPRRAAA
jgi:hypothetical protein